MKSKLLSPENVKKIVCDMHKDYADVREEIKTKAKISGNQLKESMQRLPTFTRK
ncbi:hypothetical protein CSE_06530 [Caldisericum exile AZM16c01]|uniref:Uncharacterized protein n=1 Tax=Caldisericum exile (strain DSM 21853 / NBRC 104410 / AZM16c01) TaxID=511051 RepID=A0A7U6JFT3_CALEA|nr:hypothetical protein CSE_06530 [Caldisericum exile AZM16c01]